MIKNILCDIGNVLLLFDFQHAVRALNHRKDIGPEMAEDIIIRHRDPMEIGETTAEQFLDDIIRDLDFTGTREEARALYADIFTPNAPMWARIRRWREEGRHLVLFSNISPIHAEHIDERYPDFSLFHEAIYSFRSRDLKPGPGMYRDAIRDHHLLPTETFYLDDRPENIAAGRAFGFHSHLYDAQYDPAADAAFQSAEGES